MRATYLVGFALAAVFPLGCGGGRGTEPDDMSARDHRRAAAGDEAEADSHEAEYDPDARSTGSAAAQSRDIVYGLDAYDPSEPHLAAAQRLHDLAAEHQAAAASLEAFEAEECARFPAATRVVCPLLGQLSGVDDIDGGVRLRFAEGVNLEAVADHLRCHVAFARTRGREGMSHCPMYVEGARVGADGGVTLTTGAGTEAVAELRRRARAHVSR